MPQAKPETLKKLFGSLKHGIRVISFKKDSETEVQIYTQVTQCSGVSSVLACVMHAHV